MLFIFSGGMGFASRTMLFAFVVTAALVELPVVVCRRLGTHVICTIIGSMASVNKV